VRKKGRLSGPKTKTVRRSYVAWAGSFSLIVFNLKAYDSASVSPWKPALADFLRLVVLARLTLSHRLPLNAFESWHCPLCSKARLRLCDFNCAWFLNRPNLWAQAFSWMTTKAYFCPNIWICHFAQTSYAEALKTLNGQICLVRLVHLH
jgi:hypothetical protein